MARNVLVVVAAVGFLGVAAAASPQVACDNPDNLCTGDPCVVQSLMVDKPCIADFSPRTLVIAGTVQVPNGGQLSLTAGTISVAGGIRSTGYGLVDVTLTASQDLAVTGSIRLWVSTPEASPNDLTLSAGGDINLAGPVRLFSHPTGAAQFQADAGGTLTVSDTILANGAHLALAGAQGLRVDAPIYAARQGAGGSVTLSSSNGGVLINDTIRVPSRKSDIAAQGGRVRVSAAGDVVVNGRIAGLARDVGPEVSLVSSGGDVTVNGRITARRGGQLTVQAAGVATLNQPVVVGGSTLGSRGEVHVEAPSVVVAPSVAIRGNSHDFGGEYCFKATGGNLALSGGFFARSGGPGPGSIEASATGNLLADGAFRVAPGGCIALTAGGTLDTSAGTFDTALSPDCPNRQVDCAP